ncbi:MerR family transcriptional regulator [Amycolatopsis sp. GA6-003]|uniref:MerR family transcriptional regulator n=1 Tax=Amycolatopsis sp. GA6-003 TaxID=2652444 RepID=UPI00391720CF
MDARTAETTAGAWPPGKVAELLGVSPVTLRSWSARYGIGPEPRGRQRRYTDLDVRRLQHMRRLIESGIRPREAAATAFADAVRRAGLPADERIDDLASAAESLRPDALAVLLDDTIADLGASGAWTGVFQPLLRRFGDRWQAGDSCFGVEWLLAAEIAQAFERFSRGRPPSGARPVLLACCPAERHSLPVEALRAALLENGVPALSCGPAAPAEATVDLAAKLAPPLVVLWARSAPAADDLLAARLRQAGTPVVFAGPGWAPLAHRIGPWVGDLPSAVAVIGERVR